MTPKQLAEKLAAEGKCILCRAPAKGLVRGLCRMHRARYVKALKKVPAQLRQKFDSQLVETGQLLATRQGMRADSPPDEFAAAADQFLAAQANEIAAEIEREAVKLQPEIVSPSSEHAKTRRESQ